MKIENCRRYIVEKDKSYLMHMPREETVPRWTYSAYTAEHYRDRQEALKMAKQFGGKIRMFNPITGVITCV